MQRGRPAARLAVRTCRLAAAPSNIRVTNVRLVQREFRRRMQGEVRLS